MKTAIALAFLLAGTAWSTQSHALTLSVGSGWVDDEIETAGGASLDSPVTFTLAASGVFSLSDGYIPGDIFAVTGDKFGVSTFTMPTIPVSLGLGDTTFDAAFFDASYSHLQIALDAGTYSLSIAGSGTGGLPAGLGIRADLISPVPLPASAPLLGSALLALGVVGYSRRHKKQASA